MRILLTILATVMVAATDEGSFVIVQMNPGLKGAWVLTVLLILTATVFLSIILMFGLRKNYFIQ